MGQLKGGTYVGGDLTIANNIVAGGTLTTNNNIYVNGKVFTNGKENTGDQDLSNLSTYSYVDNTFLKLAGGTLSGNLSIDTSLFSTATYLVLGQSDFNVVVNKGANSFYPNNTSGLVDLGLSYNRWRYLYTDYLCNSQNTPIHIDTIWHSGNDGAGSGLDAGLLCGRSAELFFKSRVGYLGNINDQSLLVDNSSCYWSPNTTGNPNNGYGVLLNVSDDVSWYNQLGFGTDTHIYFRQSINSTTNFGAWNTVAFTTDNVASATKLQTARTIWGQDFDGTGNVSGAMTGVSTISASGNITTNGIVYTNGKANTGDQDLSNLSTYTYVDNTFLKLSGGQLTGQLSLLQGAGGGIVFPDNSFGGGGDSASIKLLNPAGGESTEMTFTMTNDADDIINFSVPSIDGVKINRYTVWNAGNFTNLNQLTTRNFSDLQNKPTTIDGYQITDGVKNNGGLWNISIKGRDNTAANALLQSGSGRSDDESGSTWLFLDSAGGTSAPWGIKHNQTDNYIEYYGNGSRKAYINLSNGYIYTNGKANTGDQDLSDLATKGYVDNTFLKLAGGTMTGALNFNNGTWNNVGDDVAIGDINVAGQLGLKAINTANPGIAFYNNSAVAVGNLISNAGTLQWSGNTLWHSGNDGSGSGLDADTLDGYDDYWGKHNWVSSVNSIFQSYQTLDLSNYDSNTWYPCWFTPSSYNGSTTRLVIFSGLNSNVPSWSTHPSGFSLLVDMTVWGSGWGTIQEYFYLDRYTARFGGETAFGGTQQNNMASHQIIWLRGGGIYRYWINNGDTVSSSITGYNWVNGSYTYSASPRSTQNNPTDGFTGKYLAYLNSNVASATKLQTGRYLFGQYFDGTSDINDNCFINRNAADTGIRIYNNSDTYSAIRFNDTSGNFATIHAFSDVGYLYNGEKSINIDTTAISLGHWNDPVLYVKTASKYVGINTTSPQSALDIGSGSLTLRSFTNRAANTGEGFEIGYSEGGVLQSYDRTASVYKPIYYNGSHHHFSNDITVGNASYHKTIAVRNIQGYNATDLSLNPWGGNVSIGDTSSYGYKLYLVGNSKFNGTAEFSSPIIAYETINASKNTPNGTDYNKLGIQVYSTDGSPVGIGFHRSGYSQCILEHSGDGLTIRNSGTIGTGALGNLYASTFVGNLNGNASTATRIEATVSGSNYLELVRANIADNDYFRILVGGAYNAGYVEIATADDGTEPIYVRQYSGPFSSLLRTATLLDEAGNTSFPGTVTGSRLYTGYDSGSPNSISCSGWFRSNGQTGWYNATYGGGITMDDSTYVKVSHNKAFKVTSTASDSINTDGGVLANGEIRSNSKFSYGSSAYSQYNSTTNSIDFIFN